MTWKMCTIHVAPVLYPFVLRHFALAPITNLHPFLMCPLSFWFNILWLAALLDTAGRSQILWQRTKLGDCMLTVNFVSPCTQCLVWAMWFICIYLSFFLILPTNIMMTHPLKEGKKLT
jgi:hypothetical protein